MVLFPLKKNYVVSLPVGWKVDNFESADLCTETEKKQPT